MKSILYLGLIIFFGLSQNKYVYIYDNKITFDSINLNNKLLSVNKVKYQNIAIDKIIFDVRNLLIRVLDIKLYRNLGSDLVITMKQGLNINGTLIKDKVEISGKWHYGRILLDTKGALNLSIDSVVYHSGIVGKLNGGGFSLNTNNCIIHQDTDIYSLDSEFNIKKSRFDIFKLILKNGKFKAILGDFFDISLHQANIDVNVKLNNEFQGKGSVQLRNKFNIVDADLNFLITKSKHGIQAVNYGKQMIGLPKFGFSDTNVNYKLQLNPNKPKFVLDSEKCKLKAYLLMDKIIFDLFINTPKIDLNAYGDIDYNENVELKGSGQYISLLDMKPLFMKKSNNTVHADLTWKKAKWISNLMLEDFHVELYKAQDGLSTCQIHSHFQHNPVILWKKGLKDNLHFQVYNFAKAFQMMYGSPLFKSTGVLNGNININEKNMPWEFKMEEFESLSSLSAIYLQILSLRFWASILKNKHKQWNYLKGHGYISNDKYEIDSFQMENEFFRIKGDGFIHKHKNLMNIDGALLSKSITSDIRDLMQKGDKNQILFNMYGTLEDPKITNDLKFRKLVSPILPFTLLLL